MLEALVLEFDYMKRELVNYHLTYTDFKAFCAIPTEAPCPYLASYVNLRDETVSVFCNRQLLANETCTAVEELRLGKVKP